MTSEGVRLDPIAVSVAQAAEMLGISPSVLRAHIDQGRLPVVRLPSTKHAHEQSRRVLLAVVDVKKFFETYRVAAC